MGMECCDEVYEVLPSSASMSAHMAAGALAGIGEHTVMFPVDSVKVNIVCTYC